MKQLTKEIVQNANDGSGLFCLGIFLNMRNL